MGLVESLRQVLSSIKRAIFCGSSDNQHKKNRIDRLSFRIKDIYDDWTLEARLLYRLVGKYHSLQLGSFGLTLVGKCRMQDGQIEVNVSVWQSKYSEFVDAFRSQSALQTWFDDQMIIVVSDATSGNQLDGESDTLTSPAHISRNDHTCSIPMVTPSKHCSVEIDELIFSNLSCRTSITFFLRSNCGCSIIY
jgi:hypothetical protein